MSEQAIKSRARVVVIGGGIVGCSVLYHLSKLGWQDLVLVEKLELTAGSTWHAAGNVTLFGHYPSMLRMQADAINTYETVAAETGQDIGFHKTGSLRLATNEAELAYYHKLTATYEQLGIRYQVLTPEEIPAIHPLMELDGVLGAVYTPDDGYVDPSGTTHALAKAARNNGATIYRHCPVDDLQQLDDGSWQVSTVKGSIHCDHVVMAASFWSRELALKAGVELPLYPLEHHEVITDSVADVQALAKELPSVRDPQGPNNIRQEGQGFLIGCYESRPQPWATEGIPADFGQELLAPDMDRIEPHLLRGMERIPALGNGGIKAVNNGPICYTPDTKPLIGPWEDADGLWLASGFAIGIGHGGGAGKFLAEWMDKGVPPYELFDVDPTRFGRYADKDFTVAKMQEGYIRGYDLPVAFDEPQQGRHARVSVLHNQLREKGAHFGVRNGWERPLRFSGDDCELTPFHRPGWADNVVKEVTTAQQGGVQDLSCLAKFRITGTDVAGVLQQLVVEVPVLGQQCRTYITNARGRVALMLQLACLAEDEFWLLCEAEYEQYLSRWLHRNLPQQLNSEPLTEQYGGLLVTGIEAKATLQSLNFEVADAGQQGETVVITDNSLGIQAWQLLVPADQLSELYQQVCQTFSDFGFYARSALMLQAGTPVYGRDITCEDLPETVGLSGTDSELIQLHLEDAGCDALGGEALQQNGQTLGMVCSGGWTESGSMAFARLWDKQYQPDQPLTVLLNGRDIAVIASKPLTTSS